MYAEILVRAAFVVAARLNLPLSWQAHQMQSNFVERTAHDGARPIAAMRE